jgi:SAM-dependent methyltransferase
VPSRTTLFVLAGLLACTPTVASTPHEPAPASEPAPKLEPGPELVSVRPGINDRYYGAQGLAHAIEQLETERREVKILRDPIVAALELREGMVVADLGAGTGLFLAPISRALGPTGKLYAIDIVPAFLAHLRERVASEALTNVEVVEATPTDPSLAPASVDLIFACDVYHHVEYPAEVLPRLRAALRPGGKLVLVDFHRIPGQTSKGMIKHVRADQATFTREIEAVGFVFERELGEAEGLEFEENYMLVFDRGAP